jgi:hypothetical protein
MESLIEKIITDFHERKLMSVVPREAELAEIPGKIDVVIGMRRTGKTCFLYQVIQGLLARGVAKEQILYINFDDERLLPLSVDKLHLIPDTYYRLFPAFKQEKCYFFFDEIQNLPHWEKFIRRLLDTENVHIYLTGSSAKLLSKEIATTLRGRAITTEIFPFSFRETLADQKLDIAQISRPGAATRALLSNRMRAFLQQGGFPEVQHITPQKQTRVLQEYVDVVILRDIIERHAVANVQALRALIRHLLATPATLFSVNKFYNDLKSQGISSSKNVLYEYLDYLSDVYLVYLVPIYTYSERIRRTNPCKNYLIDSGMINAFLHQPTLNWGQLLENFVFMELRRKGLQIQYYRTQDSFEVDFITTTLQGNQTLYQVALNLEDAATRLREVRALETAMKECKLQDGYIITLDQQETLTVSSGTIHILPGWQWALASK